MPKKAMDCCKENIAQNQPTHSYLFLLGGKLGIARQRGLELIVLEVMTPHFWVASSSVGQNIPLPCVSLFRVAKTGIANPSWYKQ